MGNILHLKYVNHCFQNTFSVIYFCMGDSGGSGAYPGNTEGETGKHAGWDASPFRQERCS